MSRKIINVCFVLIVLLFVSCSTENENMIKGKWVLAGKIIGSSPQSYWFQKHNKVTAPWEERDAALKSSGNYEFIDDSHIKILMHEGYFKGIIFFFKIVKLDEEELILRGSIQDIRMRRVE